MMDELLNALWLKRGGERHTLRCGQDLTLSYLLLDEARHQHRDLVLIPGLGERSSNWMRLMPRISHLGRCAAIDEAGASSDGEACSRHVTTVSAYASAVAALVAKSARPTCLVGSSMGGVVALRAACAEPTHVSAVFMLGLDPDLARLDFLNQLFDVRGADDVTRLLGRCWCEPPRLRAEDAAALLQTLQAPALRALLSDLAHLDLQIEIARAAAAGIPSFFMTGANDGLLAAGREYAASAATNVDRELVPADRRRELAHCGHYPHVEQTALCAEWIEEQLVLLPRRIDRPFACSSAP